MIAFADASALVKPYADESDHGVVRSLPTLAVAEVSRAEVVAALWGKARTADLTVEEAALLVQGFVADYEGTSSRGPRFSIVVTAGSIVRDAARPCGLHPLRAHDAVQLASALLAGQEGGETVVMVAFDRRLRAAAAREGLGLVP